MTKLILIRHAEARGNVERIFHGQHDSDITDKGKKQLEFLQKRFNDIYYDVIYSSDLKRAYITACTANYKNLDIIKDKRLREIHGGKWEDMPFDDLPKYYPKEYRHWNLAMHKTQMPQGESFIEFADRISNTIDEIIKENEGKTVVIATHGTAIKAYLCYTHGYCYSNMNDVDWCDNTSLTVINYDEKFNPTVETAGDDSHLPDEYLTMKNQEWWKRKNDLKKILTITLNPCIDKTLFVEELIPCGLNRIKKSNTNYSGKGINVSTVLSLLFTQSTATGFMPSDHKADYDDLLSDYGIDNRFVDVEGKTRVNTKVIDFKNKTQTEFNESGVAVSKEDKKIFLKNLNDLIDDKTIVVISGSTPPGYKIDDFDEMINLIKDKNARFIVDGEGVKLEKAIKNKSFFIKPNIFEFETLLGEKFNGKKEKIAHEAMKIVESGVKAVIVTLGSEGAIFVSKFGTYFVPALDVEVKGLSGAGDSALAGYLAGYVKGKTYEECIAWSVAAAAASVMTEGTNPPEIHEILTNIKKIELDSILY